MSDTAAELAPERSAGGAAGDGGASGGPEPAGTGGRRPPGLWLVVLCAVVALVGLAPWLMAAMFAPALLGAPGPSPQPLTILGIAAVLSYPLWLLYWGGRVIALRRGGASAGPAAVVMAAPAALLIATFSYFSIGP